MEKRNIPRDTARAMSEQNVEIVRRAVEAFNELGFEGVGASGLVTDDIEFHEPPEQPAPRVARGREEMQKLSGEFDEAWENHQSEPREIRTIDADRVLLVSVEHFKGRDGIELEAPFAAIFTLRDGKIASWQAFWDKQKALEAAGLSE
jgi:ketosteroid isomerase-like protein